MNRRDFLRQGATAGACVLAAPFVNRGRFQLFAGTRQYSARAISLVERSLVIDMLGLLTLEWSRLEHWQRDPGAFGPNDFEKLRSSGINVFHPAVSLGDKDIYEACRTWIAGWNGFVNRYPEYLVEVRDPAGLMCLKARDRVGIVLGFQDSSHFRSAQDVETFHGLGQRISQLTYNSCNAIGYGCTERPDLGLTGFGVEIVQAMNRCGMTIDVSHVGDRTTLDTLETSTRPVLITHANCRALAHHPRCKSDHVIRAMAAKGGVIGITGLRPFVKGSGTATLESVLDHFDHVARLVGVEHVGVGSDTDLDGRANHLDVGGLNHPRRIYDLTEGLIRRGYSDGDIELILGGNFQRALIETWTTSECI